MKKEERKRKKSLKASRASISIMLAFLIMPVYSFAGVIVDGARISSARRMVSGAGELVMNAGLASYDDVLKSVYGLFAMSEDEEELQKNLEVYFNETISNTTLADSGDEETRKYLESIRSLFSEPEKVEFDNFVKLSTDNFGISPVEGAVLTNPSVMKNQIVEYMKYLGPVSMGKGLIAKLGAFKDFNKQSEVMEAKIEYEESLGDLQDSLEKIYKYINLYNEYIVTIGITKDTINEDVKYIEEKYREASFYLGLCSAENMIISDIPYYSELESDIITEHNDTGTPVIDIVRNYLYSYITEDPELTGFEGTYSDICLSPDILFVSEVSNQFIENDEFPKEYYVVHTLVSMYENEYDGLSDEDKETYKAEKDLYSGYKQGIEDHKTLAEGIKSNWENEINRICGEVASRISDRMKKIELAIYYLDNVKDGIDELLTCLDECEKKGNEWGDKIEALSEGEMRNTMQSEYESEVKPISRTDISDFEKAVDENNGALNDVKDYFSDIKFFGFFVGEKEDDYAGKYWPYIGARAIYDESEANTYADEIMENFSKPDDEISVEFKTVASEYSFYNYLCDVCNQEEPETSEEDSKSFMDTMKDLGDTSNMKEAEITEKSKEGISANIDEEIAKAIKEMRNYDESSDEYNVGNPASSDHEDMLDNQKNILESTSDFLKNIGDLAASVVEEGVYDLYLTEYITEMFSCYTCDKLYTGGNIEEISPVTLSGVPINEDNNVFYKSEAEYILWGNEDMKKNHTYTNALIFGMRFVLNNIYAFTDAEVKSVTLAAATAIAGWTGFGVPIVRTVLIMSLALAESVLDVNELLDGGAVPIYKTKTTWHMKPSGMINAIKDHGQELANMAAEKAGEKIDDIFGKLENCANNEVDKINETMHGYIDELSESAVETAMNTVIAPIYDVSVSVINSADETITKENIENMIIEKLNLNNASAGGDDIDSVVLGYVTDFAREKTGQLADAIYQNYAKVSESAKDKIGDLRKQAQEQIENIIKPVKEKADAKVDEYSSALKDEISKGLEKAGDQAKQYAQDMANKYITGASTALTEKLSPSSSSKISFSKDSKTTSGKTITLTYKEYLKIFILLNTLFDEKEEAMLSRIATLIQINMTNGMDNIVINEKEYEKSEDFNITEAYTMLEMESEATINTWFMGMFVPNYNMNPDGSTSYDFDYSHIAAKEKKISYKGVLSY